MSDLRNTFGEVSRSGKGPTGWKSLQFHLSSVWTPPIHRQGFTDFQAPPYAYTVPCDGQLSHPGCIPEMASTSGSTATLSRIAWQLKTDEWKNQLAIACLWRTWTPSWLSLPDTRINIGSATQLYLRFTKAASWIYQRLSVIQLSMRALSGIGLTFGPAGQTGNKSPSSTADLAKRHRRLWNATRYCKRSISVVLCL